MGATLSSRAEWTSARDKGGKLDFSKANEALLVEIMGYVEALCQEHAREATVLFKRPFVWSSSLLLSNFEELTSLPNGEYSGRYASLKLELLVCIIWNSLLQWIWSGVYCKSGWWRPSPCNC
jgi:hypothetical protein